MFLVESAKTNADFNRSIFTIMFFIQVNILSAEAVARESSVKKGVLEN